MTTEPLAPGTEVTYVRDLSGRERFDWAARVGETVTVVETIPSGVIATRRANGDRAAFFPEELEPTTELTVASLDRMTKDPRWSKFGYLGERARALTSDDPDEPARPERVAEADADVVRRANAAGMDYEALFEWANSKPGRHYGSVVFGGGTFDQAADWRTTPGLAYLD